jgi:hypothetical protein
MDETWRTIMSDQYYDISVRACGFLNQVRQVEPKDRASYFACSFAALRGPKGERAEPTYFDLRAVGDQAANLLRLNKSVINDRSRQVFASVKLSDLYVKSFLRTKGEHKGETGFAVKSRLLVIESLAIDGVVAYRRADDPTMDSRPSRASDAPPRGARSAGARA